MTPSAHRRGGALAILGCAVALLALATGCAGAGGTKAARTVTVSLGDIHGLGPVLTTDKGFALYSFPPDKQKSVTCTGRCAQSWPPLTVADNGKVLAGQGVREALLGTVRADGKRVVTYDKWPLYTYRPDVQPHTATGQALNLNGGYWYVLAADGTPITKPYLR